MPCGRCVEAAHGAAVRATEARAREVHGGHGQPSAELLRMLHTRQCDARAAWVGANVLLDELGLLLLRVGLELPTVDVGARGTR